jgi:hypothetical protein
VTVLTDATRCFLLSRWRFERKHIVVLQGGVVAALKFLLETVTKATKHSNASQGEAQSASALDDPNICTIHDITDQEPQLFIASG